MVNLTEITVIDAQIVGRWVMTKKQQQEIKDLQYELKGLKDFLIYVNKVDNEKIKRLQNENFNHIEAKARFLNVSIMDVTR